jgi:hypothetical protein
MFPKWKHKIMLDQNHEKIMVTQKITQKNSYEHYGKNPIFFLKKGLKGRPHPFLDIYFCPFFKTESTFFLNFFPEIYINMKVT